MTKRTEALSAAWDQFRADSSKHGKQNMTKEQFICYALSALPSSGPKGPAEDLPEPPVRVQDEDRATEQEQG